MTTNTIPDAIERELVLPQPIERVWRALTDPAELGQWFGDTAEIDLRPGGAARFRWGDEGCAAIIHTVEPPSRFAVWWVTGGGDAMDDGNRTLVEFTLEPVDAGTRLRLVESGFTRLADPAKHHAGNTEGWTAELGDLEAYLRGDTAA